MMESRAEYQRLYRERNRERINQYYRDYNKKNREKRREIERSWKERNPEKVKEMNARAGSKWAKANPAAKNAITAKRRAALLQRTPPYADLDKIKEFYILAEKLSKETGIRHEVDHIFPLQGKLVSGLHIETNLQVITRSKNRSKKNK